MNEDFEKFMKDSRLMSRTQYSSFSVTSNDVQAWLFAAYQQGVLDELRRRTDVNYHQIRYEAA